MGWELSRAVFFSRWHGGRSLVVFQGNMVEFFFCFSRNYFFGGVGWGGLRKRVGGYFVFFFHHMVTL